MNYIKEREKSLRNSDESSEEESTSEDYSDETGSTRSEDLDNDETVDFTGMQLNNRYVPMKCIGYGSYSSVWLSFCKNSKKCFAIKIQFAEDYEDGRIVQAELMEIHGVMHEKTQESRQTNRRKNYEIVLEWRKGSWYIRRSKKALSYSKNGFKGTAQQGNSYT